MSYLVIKSASNATPMSFLLTSTAEKPRLAVGGSYLPLASTGGGATNLKVKVNDVPYRAKSYSTVSSSSSSSTKMTTGYAGTSSKASYYPVTSSAQGDMSSTTALTRSSTSGYTGYLFDRDTLAFIGSYLSFDTMSQTGLSASVTISNTGVGFRVKQTFTQYAYNSTTSNLKSKTASFSWPNWGSLNSYTTSSYNNYASYLTGAMNSIHPWTNLGSSVSNMLRYSRVAESTNYYQTVYYSSSTYTRSSYGPYITILETIHYTSGSYYLTSSAAPGSMSSTTALTRSSTSGYSGSLSRVSYYYTESTAKGNMSSTTALTSSTSASTSASTTSYV